MTVRINLGSLNLFNLMRFETFLETYLRENSNLVIVTLAGVAAGCIATYTGMKLLAFFGRKGWRKKDRERYAAVEALARLSGQLVILSKKKGILEGYTGDYFHTFNQAGWQEFVYLVEDLQAIECSIHLLIDEGKFRQAHQVTSYLLGELDREDSRKVEQAWESLSDFADWRSRSNQYLVKLVQATTTSAEETRSLGITRRHRKPTLLSMAELRKGLVEE